MRSAHLKYLNEEKVKQRWSSNSTYRLRYWNLNVQPFSFRSWWASCNNTYRLRYVPQSVRQQRSKATMRSAHCLPERREGKTKAIKKCTTVYSIETLPLQKTRMDHMPRCNNTYCLRYWNSHSIVTAFSSAVSCDSTYRLRYWNNSRIAINISLYCCDFNSTYRLRYWNDSPDTNAPLPIATHRKYLSKAKVKQRR